MAWWSRKQHAQRAEVPSESGQPPEVLPTVGEPPEVIQLTEPPYETLIERILDEAEARAEQMGSGEQFAVVVPIGEWPSEAYPSELVGPVMVRSVERHLVCLSARDNTFTFLKP